MSGVDFPGIAEIDQQHYITIRDHCPRIYRMPLEIQDAPTRVRRVLSPRGDPQMRGLQVPALLQCGVPEEGLVEVTPQGASRVRACGGGGVL